MSDDTTPQGEGFLSRWSRRKQEVAPEPAKETAIAPPEALPPEPEPMPELPSLDSLLPGQDISVFMHPAVPQSLRNAALRKMWVMDPAIRDFVSEALDYAYDYNTPGMAPGFGPLQTTPDMIREVSDIMDRAMSHHAAEPETMTALLEKPEKPEETALIEGEPDAEAVNQVPPLPKQGNTLVLDASQQSDILPQTVDSSSQKTAIKTEARRRSARRHGGALPS